jgi:lactoylglutathione lyase
MLSHCFVGVNDFEAALRFYSAIHRELGHSLRFCDRDRPWAGWQQPGVARPLFLIGTPENGKPAAPGNGQMVALLCPSRDLVRRVYAAGLAAGGSDAGPPGLRLQYHADYFGAYLRDPDGNKLALACHGPE